MEWATVDTPIGAVSVAASDGRICRLSLGSVENARPATGQLAEAVDQVAAFFTGERTTFDLLLAEPTGSDFERAVWGELIRIPYGQTRTYGQVARAVGDAGAARAVGTACHRNPLPLIVPCHRVVGAGGKLVGFGGGLPRKRWLLEHEARVSFEQDWS